MPLNVQQAEIMRAFNSEFYISNRMDVQPSAIWCRLRFNKGDEFTRHNNQKLFALTRNDDMFTNMDRANVLPVPCAIAIQKYVISFPRMSNQVDVTRYTSSTLFEFYIGQKPYMRRPLSLMDSNEPDPQAPVWTCQYCSAVFANQDACPGCGSRDFSMTAHLPNRMPGGTVLFVDIKGHEQTIENQIHFDGRLNCSAGGHLQDDMEVHISLMGLYARNA